jgi:hypothetical protein
VASRAQTPNLDKLRGMTSQPPAPSSHAPEQPYDSSPPQGRLLGRPRAPEPEQTMQISLRIPRAWLSKLRRKAVEASAAEEKTITPQEIVRRLVGTGLKIDG